jgi:hypothetical protein
MTKNNHHDVADNNNKCTYNKKNLEIMGLTPVMTCQQFDIYIYIYIYIYLIYLFITKYHAISTSTSIISVIVDSIKFMI